VQLTPAKKILKELSAKNERQQWELVLLYQIQKLSIPEPVRYFKPIPGRNFTSDMAYPDIKLLIEVDGAQWVKGGHNSGYGKERDCEKDALAVLEGYKTLRFPPSLIESGFAVGILEKLFKGTK
jgi:very-short-patch-repair endonuclease